MRLRALAPDAVRPLLTGGRLLIEPETGIAVILDEAKERARESGCDWLTLASAWAGRMLPQIFRTGDPVLGIARPPEMRTELEALWRSSRALPSLPTTASAKSTNSGKPTRRAQPTNQESRSARTSSRLLPNFYRDL